MHRQRCIAGLVFAICLGTLLSVVAAQEKEAAEFARPLASIELNDGDTFVFLGDSITHQCLYTQYFEDYFFTRYPDVRVRFHNAGVGGDRAADALIRFERDVAHYKPKYVSILLGMNDGGYRPFDAGLFQRYHDDMLELLRQIKDCGATPILMHPTMFDSRAAYMRNPNTPADRAEYYNGVLAYYGAWLREVAYREGLGYVDMYSWLNQLTFSQRKRDPKFTVIPDAVHPGPAGQAIMAAAMVRDLGLPDQVWKAELLVTQRNAVVVRMEHCIVSDVIGRNDRIRFTLNALALPWVLPEEALPGARLVQLGHRFSRETLRVRGLPPGLYELRANGQPVGRFRAEQLAVGIELQDRDAWPLRQQAAQVAQLNKRRNEEAVRPLRNLWSARKRLRLVRAALKQNPDDTALKRQEESLKRRLADFEQQIRALEERAASIEDEIYRINNPRPVRVEIDRVKE